jgi:murein DD-endopeptidase MepM/ murein hydrolase activator NlpD
VAIRENIRNYIKRSREKHKLTFINDSNFHEKWSLRVSSMNLITLLIVYTLVIVVSLLLLLRYTPLKGVLIDQNLYATTDQIRHNAISIDSMYAQTRANELYLENLKRLLNDEPLPDSLRKYQSDSLLENYTPNFNKVKEDELLRQKVEAAEKARLTASDQINFEFFFSPVEGTVSQSFNPNKNHFGVDVVTADQAPVKACLEGTVILTGWIQAEGNTIAIQHKNNLISVYKHCSTLLKKQGEKVQLGDPIAIVGNTGENTNGPHLHFELWKNGRFIDPELYISF